MNNTPKITNSKNLYLILIAAFWLGVILLMVLSLLPGKQLPSVKISDKLQHFLAYFILATAGFSIYSRKAIICFLVILGGSLELLQGFMGYNRYAEWYDFFANSAGVFLALIFYIFLERIFRNKEI